MCNLYGRTKGPQAIRNLELHEGGLSLEIVIDDFT
jgi:hypothetical protein